MNQFGIDAISVYVPKLALSLDNTWASYRKEKDPNFLAKVNKGIGMYELSIPDSYEDIITMAANATIRLIEDHNIDLDKIGYIAFATESGLDHSKSASSFLIGALSSYFNKKLMFLGGVDFQFACISSSYALETTLALLESNRIGKPYAILISSDIAKYPLGSSGEYTQGAGAVAMLIKKNPKLIAFRSGPFTTVTTDVNDFYRPIGHTYPTVDGKYSVEIYSSLMQMAFALFNADEYQEFDKYLFHLPYPKIVEHAIFAILSDNYQNLNADQRKEAKKNFFKMEKVIKFMEEKVNSSLKFAAHIGNIYTGSIFLGLVSLLKHDHNLEGKELLFCAYGSGASSKIYAGQILPSYLEIVEKISLDLSTRHKLTIDEYVKIHETSNLIDAIINPTNSFHIKTINNGLPQYSYHK